MPRRPPSRRLNPRPIRGRGNAPKPTGGRTGTDNQELIANGVFASSAGWALGTGWTVAAGVLTAAAVTAAGAVASTTFAVSPLAQGAVYRVVFTLLTTTLGSVRFQFTGGATLNGATQNADGTYSQDVVATAAHTGFQFIAVADYTGSIDNLSLRRVG